MAREAMSRTARNLLTLTIFIVAAFVGPAIRCLNWPPGSSESFIPDLVLLLWPTQPLAVMEINTGQTVAAAVAIGANVVVFIFLGILAILAGNWRFGILALYVIVALALMAMSYWWMGFNTAYVNWLALFFALVIYGAVFGIARKTLRKPRHNPVSDKNRPA